MTYRNKHVTMISSLLAPFGCLSRQKWRKMHIKPTEHLSLAYYFLYYILTFLLVYFFGVLPKYCYGKNLLNNLGKHAQFTSS